MKKIIHIKPKKQSVFIIEHNKNGIIILIHFHMKNLNLYNHIILLDQI